MAVNWKRCYRFSIRCPICGQDCNWVPLDAELVRFECRSSGCSDVRATYDGEKWIIHVETGEVIE